MQPDEGLFTRQMPGDRFREQTDPVLQLEKINVNFDGFQALTDLSLNIGVGELRCIIGPNGAGKTTLMDVITGKTRPQSGRAIYDQSTDLTTLDPIAIARQGIGRKFQKPTVFEALTVEENLDLALKNDKSVWGLYGHDSQANNRIVLMKYWRCCGWVMSGPAAPVCFRMGKNSFSKLACCWCRSRIYCYWMNPRRG